ncbi:dickkopf-related protein 3-like [Brevipalpus obovatus]|uniref:dickkopf-related protein 3-like n=1 Tax=Brevipalpus obovatus TaxID=246614 RepID=UPI003D9E2E19
MESYIKYSTQLTSSCMCRYAVVLLIIHVQLIKSETNFGSTLSNIRCSKNEDCQRDDSINFFCDSHYGFCDVKRIEMDLCRRDEQCDKNLICMFGKCQREPTPGNRGSRCKSDSDCKSHMCCARQHGEKVCKLKLQRNQRCYVPTGGLDYSLNELCPCDSGLVCSKKKRKNRRRDSQGSPMDRMRCQRIHMPNNE